MKAAVFKRKLDDKLGFDVPEFSPSNPEFQPKTKREMTEGHHKRKRCICGLHSIRGHKEKSKYPQWKKRRKKGRE